MRLLAIALVASTLGAQNPQRHFTEGVDMRFGRSTPVLVYRLTASDADTTGFDVQLTIKNAPDTFRLAMAKHPEYDDGFFRYVELKSDAVDARITITRQDSVTWRVVAPGGNAVIPYRIALPTRDAPRPAWVPFLSPTGGLTGGPHAFMYMVGAELAPAHVELRIPSSWRVATGLTPTADDRTYFASNAYVLLESPIFVGRFNTSRFSVDGVPHTVAYWPGPKATRFDTTAFRGALEGITNEAVKLFGRPPYREYVFIMQDDAYGGLEHHNSVTLGTPSKELAEDSSELLGEIAHEFIHTWNLVRIRPSEYIGVSTRRIQPVPTLWFSEGLTMFYADLLRRRAGLPASGATRVAHVEGILARNLSLPGNERFSAEQVSRTAYNSAPDALGDYIASAHLQGEVLGTMLDLLIRDATNGKRSMDHVMRLLHERAAGPTGMTGADIEAAAASVCACVVKPFFDAYVRGAQPINYNRYLGLVGLKVDVRWDTVRSDNGALSPDHRLWAYLAPGDSLLALAVNNPTTIWGKAGLHSGERVVTLQGNSVRTWNEFRRELASSRIGDPVHLVVKPRGALPPRTVTVIVGGYTRPFVTITEISGATEKQIRLRDAWLSGTP